MLFRGNYIKIERLTKLSIVFFIIGIIANTTYRHFENIPPRNFVMSSDMEGYYQYLPYVFLQKKETIKNMRWAKEYENGNKLNVFTCGVAIMQLPFFLAAHGTSNLLGFETNGYTSVYFMSVFWATLSYVLIGLIFLYKALLRFFKKHYALLTTALIFYATNLFYYTIMSPGMSHAYSFCLVSIYIYFVPLFYDKTSIKNTLFVAVPFALAVLIRPTTIIAGLYFLLFDVDSFNSFSARLKLLLQKWYLIILMFLTAVVIFIPQMLYWHYVTGKFIIYSYQEEGFTNILSPYISTVLIGARNGLFLYSPIMIFAFGSLFHLTYKKKFSALGILLLIAIIIYIDASWWRPTFSGAAGYRALIEYFPFMAIPLSYLIQKIMDRNIKWQKYGMKSLLLLFVIYNVLFAYKYSHWLWWNTDWQWSYFLRLIKF